MAITIGGGEIFLVGAGSSGETKTAEGIRGAKNRRFVLYIAFAGKSGGGYSPLPTPPSPAPPPMITEPTPDYKLKISGDQSFCELVSSYIFQLFVDCRSIHSLQIQHDILQVLCFKSVDLE